MCKSEKVPIYLVYVLHKVNVCIAADGEDECMQCVECCCSSTDCCSEDLGVESMADDHSVDFEFNFEEACHRYE